MLVDPDGNSIAPADQRASKLFYNSVANKYGRTFANEIMKNGTLTNGKKDQSIIVSKQYFNSRKDFDKWAKSKGVDKADLNDAYKVYQALSDNKEIQIQPESPPSSQSNFSLAPSQGEGGTSYGESDVYRSMKTTDEGHHQFMDDFQENGVMTDEQLDDAFQNNLYGGEQVGKGAGLWFEEKNVFPDGRQINGVLIIDDRTNVPEINKEAAVLQVISENY